MANSGTWKPGRSGNPNGRPLKNRTLTTILEKAGSKTVYYEGKKVSGKRLLARLLWNAALTGKARLPEDAEGQIKTISLSPKDWMDLAKWIYIQIDGPPRAELDISSLGEKLATLEVIPIDYRAAIAPLAPRPVGDSAASGEGESSFDGETLG